MFNRRTVLFLACVGISLLFTLRSRHNYSLFSLGRAEGVLEVLRSRAACLVVARDFRWTFLGPRLVVFFKDTFVKGVIAGDVAMASRGFDLLAVAWTGSLHGALSVES